MVSVIERKIRRGLYRHTSCIALHFMVSHRCYVFLHIGGKTIHQHTHFTGVVWNGTHSVSKVCNICVKKRGSECSFYTCAFAVAVKHEANKVHQAVRFKIQLWT